MKNKSWTVGITTKNGLTTKTVEAHRMGFSGNNVLFQDKKGNAIILFPMHSILFIEWPKDV